MTSVREIMDRGPVIPVLAYRSVEEAVNVSSVLVEAGVVVLEITLRHPTALASIEAVAKALPEALVGAGTVLDLEQARRAKEAGAVFGVSPGLTPALAEGIRASQWPFLPGVASVSEAMSAHSYGFDALKFFPAEASGGLPFLKSIAPVLPSLSFCPTGGVKASNYHSYLSLDNVACVGGSWLSARETDGSIDLQAVRVRAQALSSPRASQ